MIELLDSKSLTKFHKHLVDAPTNGKRFIRVCCSTGCQALGGQQVLAALEDQLQKHGVEDEIELVSTGCRGFCERGPHVSIYPEKISYNRVAPSDAQAIVEKTILGGTILPDLLYKDHLTGTEIIHDFEIPFYSRQTRRVLALNGVIDPSQIEDYLRQDGYLAMDKAINQMDGDTIIEEVKKAGLRGRGGAGFLTGAKWELCRRSPGKSKFVVCNADEGDPGAFMDRSILEGNPHSVIEGMVIGAFAIGATKGFVYIRNEYPLAVEHLDIALQQARSAHLLGENILGSGFDFDIEIRFGSGAFICGEETALMASIEGQIGEPRPRPPYPTERGLWGYPTNINNVKTWANVPLIIREGADWFAELGTENSKGTMIFSLVGNIQNTGLVEVPMGITLGELIFEVGGGIPGGKSFKAAQIGGPSGGCIPKEHLDVPVDYESLNELGAIMGSGGLVVCDEDTCMVDLARYFLQFTQEESCGKCAPCRIGTRAILDVLDRICAGESAIDDLDYLMDLCEVVQTASLCGLGQTAPNPVLTTLRYFREEYETHIIDKKCPAKVCKGLIVYEIDPESCTGCMVCARNCPSDAITGEKGQPHTIEPDLCTRCGVCKSLCQFDAVVVH